MGRFVAIGIVVVMAACGKKSAHDDCLSGKADFLRGLREAFDERISSTPPQQMSGARAFFDAKYQHAEAAFDAYCKRVTDAEWACMHEVVESGKPPAGDCKAVADRFMKDVLDESNPDYH
jgi:hypothetical protein